MNVDKNDVPVASESTRLLVASNGSNSNGDTKGDDGNGDEDERLSSVVVALSFTLMVQSYLLVSVFPYSGFMAMKLISGLNEDTAGSYAGLIAASFMAGRTFSSFEWGKAADRYGRVTVIEVSLLLSAFFSILFGLATSFPMALILRFMLGMCNGLMGTVKTLVSEYAKGDEKKETRMFSVILGMWGFGFLVNPPIAGYLSDPIKQYPGVEFGSIMRPMLEEFPFFLPNLVGGFVCLLGYVLVHNFVEETLPEEKRQKFRVLPSVCPCNKSQPMMRNVSSWGLFKHLHNSKGENNSDDSNLNVMLASSQDKEDEHKKKDGEEQQATIYSLMKRKSTRQHLMVYWVYEFLCIILSEVFPLFCMSTTSGLGIQEKEIGNILSGCGLLYVCMQYSLVTKIVDRFGFYKAMRIGIFLSGPLSLFFPLSLITNRGAPDGALTMSTLVFLSALFAIIRAFSTLVFSTITMATNRTVPSNQQATLNGLSMLGGSFSKAFGPLFGGVLFSASVGTFSPPYGSVVVYGTTAFLGICISVLVYFLREYDEHEKDESTNNEDTTEGKIKDSELELESEEAPAF